MQDTLSKRLEDNISYLDDKFSDCPDIKRQRLQLKDGTDALISYIEGMTNIDLLQRDIIPNLLKLDNTEVFNDNMQTTKLPAASLSIVNDLITMITDIMKGKTIVLINGYDVAISLSVKKVEKRNISEPIIEKNVRGSHEAFVESIETNISILRRKIKNNKLKFKMLNIGSLTNQTVVIAYIQDVANEENIDLVYNKLKSVDYDGVFDVGFLEQLLADNKYTPFPHFQATERPDKTMASLQEGKLAVFLDGSPSALLMPISFFSAFQAPDDYNSNWLVGSLNRLVRLFALVIAIFLPSLYIAIVSYHYYMVPLNLLVPLAQSRAKVPFPPIIEVLILEYTIEMLREATIRLPTYIGTSIGIVGGLIIGQAAVDAGIVSNLIIIVVAVTALASYLIPNYDMGIAVRYIRFIVMLFASIFGIIGIVICSLVIIAHLVVIESLGEPYFKPVLPFKIQDIKDIILRPSLKALQKRPSTAKSNDIMRGKKNG